MEKDCKGEVEHCRKGAWFGLALLLSVSIVYSLAWYDDLKVVSYVYVCADATSWKQTTINGSIRPTRRYQHSATAIGNKIYYIGGQETQTRRFDDIYEFNTGKNMVSRSRTTVMLQTHHCTQVTNSEHAEQLKFKKLQVEGSTQPPRFARHTAIAMGKQIFIFGGFDGQSMYAPETPQQQCRVELAQTAK